jgi:hypothetical protein
MRAWTVPIVATSLGTVLLYTNLPVVASQRGIIPSAAAAVVPFLLLVAAVHQLVIRRRPIVVDRTLVAMVVFLAVFLVSSFAAEGHAVAVSRITVYVTEGIAIYVLVRHAVRALPELRAAMSAVLLSAALLGGLATIQAATGNYDQEFLGLAQRAVEHLDEQPASSEEEMGLEDRARGPVGEPNRFAQILLMAAPLGLLSALDGQRARSRAAALLCFGLVLAGVMLTYSRGAFVTLLVLVMLTVPLRLIPPRRLLAASLVGLALVPLVAPGYGQRVASIAGVADLFGTGSVEADGPTRGRTTEMLAALAAFVEHPVIGVGPGQYLPYHSVHYQSLPEISVRAIPEPRRAHNLFLELGAETGTLGLVIFMAIPLLLLRDLEATRRALMAVRPDLARMAAAFQLVLLSYLGTGVFLHLAFERYYWFIVGLAAAATSILTDSIGRAVAADQDDLPC